jgi:hypothetical protein
MVLLGEREPAALRGAALEERFDPAARARARMRREEERGARAREDESLAVARCCARALSLFVVLLCE